jgi:hypothetical protein
MCTRDGDAMADTHSRPYEVLHALESEVLLPFPQFAKLRNEPPLFGEHAAVLFQLLGGTLGIRIVGKTTQLPAKAYIQQAPLLNIQEFALLNGNTKTRGVKGLLHDAVAPVLGDRHLDGLRGRRQAVPGAQPGQI